MKKLPLLFLLMTPMVALVLVADHLHFSYIFGLTTLAWVCGCFSGILMWLMVIPKQNKKAEEEFKRQFITSFIAAWSASNYDEACYSGGHERLEHVPVEDAQLLAENAWKKWSEDVKPQS